MGYNHTTLLSYGFRGQKSIWVRGTPGLIILTPIVHCSWEKWSSQLVCTDTFGWTS